MRPPMQKTALQQNEANHNLQQHQHQHQHQHLQQQQSHLQIAATQQLLPHKHSQQPAQPTPQHPQPPLAVTAPAVPVSNLVDCNALISATTAAARKSQKLEQHELLVENHLNSVCFAQAQLQQQPPAHLQAILQPQARTSPLEQHAPPAKVYYNDFFCQQQQQQQQQQQHSLQRGLALDEKLLDLSTSPPAREDDHLSHSAYRPATADSRDTAAPRQTPTGSQRFSYTSQYSRSSSSDDSSSLSLSTACGSLSASGPPGPHQAFANLNRDRSSSVYNTGSSSHSSYNNTFDDAAENFIINFPADTTPTPTHSTPPPPPCPQSSSDYQHSAAHGFCLPLSETEPLLTNIEATVRDKQRSIYLNKNSASLIFTKKDLSQTAATYQQQQQQKLQSKTNNNFNGVCGSSSASSNATSCPTTLRRPLTHSTTTLRSFSEDTYSSTSSSGRRRPTKHLPASYHQQHRRSLQLNYNNNLVTTSTCGSLANNNHHHHCATNGVAPAKSCNSNSAVLHKPSHHSNHNYQPPQQQQQQAKFHPPHHHQGNNCASNNTAAATRKQYAYSWYAPVYSALEEELEHDSRESSPIHNLATAKKQNLHQYHRQLDLKSTASTQPAAVTDSEREALLETRNSINIQSHLGSGGNHLKRGDPLVRQLNASKLGLTNTAKGSAVKGSLHPAAKGIGLNGSATGGGVGGGGSVNGSGGDIASVEGFGGGYDLEGPHAGSLGLAGGPQPRRIRFGNFLKSLVGLRPSLAHRQAAGSESTPAPAAVSGAEGPDHGQLGSGMQIPSSPEITITRTPSEQNMVVMRDPAGRQDYNVVYSSREKLANSHGERRIQTGSTSSLNVMQQKLWNIMRRDGSALSLHQEKSQSIVHYTGLRKCETVIALTRQANSPCSPTLGGGGGGYAAGASANGSKSHQALTHTGSGIFSASGVEQIRPLNRLRNSVSSMNNTCSRCSSLLSLAASSSRFSVSNGTLANQHPQHAHQHQHHQPAPHSAQQHQRHHSTVSSSNISSTFSHSRDGSLEAGGLHFAARRGGRGSGDSQNVGCQRSVSCTSSTLASSSRTPSITSPSATTATTVSTLKLTTPPPPPTDITSPPAPKSLKLMLSPIAAPAPRGGDTKLLSPAPEATPLLQMPTLVEGRKDASPKLMLDTDVIDGGGHSSNKGTPTTLAAALAPSSSPLPQATPVLPLASISTNVTPSTSANALTSAAAALVVTAAASASASAPVTPPESVMATTLLSASAAEVASAQSCPPQQLPFELFTCKLCLIDVEDASNSTVLHQCGCQFCTECMKAYVEFEISEGAYEISCPDAQCPDQGVMTLPEIAALTTNNLMKKHHRYRLNREIELDKTRTWCPRAGCETVCLIGATSAHGDAMTASASTSAAAAASSATPSVTMSASSNGLEAGGGAGSLSITSANGLTSPLLCAVQCPSCKDEFCSACKKTWHPNITCEENSRRLAADGQDDIGIPFDNDLIKCCPMCAVPIEKDEGCAQMMCKRCKHVFCWYCLASLDDDFLLRHYDKGPCKNKLGHSRASVVWHRAQVIGIFAGFGILLLVASPLLLLAAPCIICCKCRGCSGSKIDEGDGDMDEATALQSLN